MTYSLHVLSGLLNNFFSKGKLIILLIFFVSLLVGTHRVSELPIYPDEITWMVRGKETALAIRTLNFKYFDSAWWNITNDTESIALPLTISVGFPIIYLGRGQSILSFNLLQDYLVARYAVVTLSALFMGAYYYFSKLIFDKKVALFSSILLFYDPIFVANSRLIMTDIYLTIFMFLAICCYLFIKKRWLSEIFSALFIAASFLTKPHGLLLLPVLIVPSLISIRPRVMSPHFSDKSQKSLFTVLLHPWTKQGLSPRLRSPRFLRSVNNKQFKTELAKYLITVLMTFVFVTILWPASWHNPIFAITEYLFRQKDLVNNGINTYFMGKLTNNPPVYYYLVQMIIRVPPIILFGFLSYLYFLTSSWKNSSLKPNYVIFTFFSLFLIFVSISAKKLGVRYALPLWPWIYLFAGKGILGLLSKIKNPSTVGVGVVMIISFSVRTHLSLFPNNYLYYNSLIGGSKNAQKYDVVGLCSGSKQAVSYISKCYPQEKEIAVLGCGSSTIPYYWPHWVTTNWKNENILVIEKHFLQLKRDPEVVKFNENNIPSHTIKVFGADLAYLYVKDGVFETCNTD